MLGGEPWESRELSSLLIYRIIAQSGAWENPQKPTWYLYKQILSVSSLFCGVSPNIIEAKRITEFYQEPE